MIPSIFVHLESLPLSPNGKIERKLLPEPIFSKETNYIPPKTDLEKKLCVLWEKILHVEQVGITDNFFKLGGNSLSSVGLLYTMEHEFSIRIPLIDFISKPTIAEILSYKKEDHIIDQEKQKAKIINDANWFVDISSNLRTQTKSVEAILLTGANGFLGVHLLSELLDQTTADIYCLIRDKEPRKKLFLSLERYNLTDIRCERIKLLSGDLGKPHLGLSEKTWCKLGKIIDVIYHNDAWVHHLYDYEQLKSTNVESTKSLIQLATTEKLKTLYYISTASAASKKNAQGNIVEEGPADLPKSLIGYLATKWVSEKILWNMFQKGLPGNIYRPGNVTGNSVNGISNYANNHSWLLLKGCVQFNAAPNWNLQIEMTPVDILAKAIVCTQFNLKRQCLQFE